MTYQRNQRMEAFKRAMFAGLLDRSPVAQPRESTQLSRNESSWSVPALKAWGAEPATGALVH